MSPFWAKIIFIGLGCIFLIAGLSEEIFFFRFRRNIEKKLGHSLRRDNSFLFSRGFSAVASLKNLIKVNPELSLDQSTQQTLRALKRYEVIVGVFLGSFILLTIIFGGLGLLN